MTLIKSISGIRGTIGGPAGEGLTPVDIVKFTYAYCAKLRERKQPFGKKYKVVVGRDARLSGEMVEQLVCGTLVACGVDVVKCGFASTPTTELAVTFSKADGGIILTASHNPRQWNALKLLNEHGEFLTAAQGQAILDGLIGGKGVVGYGASKAGCLSLARTMANNFGRENITVNCICPGYVVTPLNEEFFIDKDGNQTDYYKQQSKATSVRRLGTIEEISGPVLAMCSDSFSYMTGTYILCDGGQSIPAE